MTAPTSLQVAEAGGRHAGFLRHRRGRTADELRREAQSLRRRADEHAEKIKSRDG